MKNNRPYKYDVKDRIDKNKKNFKNNKINYTNQYEKKNNSNKGSKKKINTKIRIDMNRINDSDSLDTSFLEGRIVSSNKKEKKVKEKILKNRSEEKIKTALFLRKVFSSLAVIAIIFLIIVFSVNTYTNYYEHSHKKRNVTDANSVKKENIKVIDNNYLFVGGFYTNDFDFESLDLDYHYVKAFDNSKTTKDILDDMKKNIYNFNPSIIFLELGISDLKSGISIDEFYSNLRNIIKLIKENRPYSKIYIESFYPINDSIEDFNRDDLPDDYNNDLIVEYNNKLKNIVSDLKVNYLDVFSMLENEGVLNSEFTNDGVHLNEDGYRQVLKAINRVVG